MKFKDFLNESSDKQQDKLLPKAHWRQNNVRKPVKRTTIYSANYYIMNASSVYNGKVSEVAKELTGRSVILIDTKNKIAIIGSASGMKDDENGLDYYGVGKGSEDTNFDYTIDTGHGYKKSSKKIYLDDYILVNNGEILTQYTDAKYKYWVFK